MTLRARQALQGMRCGPLHETHRIFSPPIPLSRRYPGAVQSKEGSSSRALQGEAACTFHVVARRPSFSGMPWKARRRSCFRLMGLAASSCSKRRNLALCDGLLPDGACCAPAKPGDGVSRNRLSCRYSHPGRALRSSWGSTAIEGCSQRVPAARLQQYMGIAEIAVVKALRAQWGHGRHLW